MKDGRKSEDGRDDSVKKMGRTIWDDLSRKDLRRRFKQDFSELYHFYLDEERQAELKKMHGLKRVFFLSWWSLKTLFFRLNPARRIMLVGALVIYFVMGRVSVSREHFSLLFDFSLLSVFVVLVVLMLELKDKTTAKDELAVGRAVQMALLPERGPEVPGWDVWMYTRPANDVGGDLVDHLPSRQDRVALVLGDVTGKGLGAALLMAKLQSTIRAIVPDFEDLPSLGARVNRILCRDGIPGRFATLVLLEVSASSGEVRVLNCGHMSPMFLRGGEAAELEPAALPLGIMPDAEYVEQSLELEPGGVLLVYSDGVTEAFNASGECFGDERLRRLWRFVGRDSPEKAGRRVLEEVSRFSGDEKPSDDLSLIILRRKDISGVRG